MTHNLAWGDLAARLVAALKPIAVPIGIAFLRDHTTPAAPPFEARIPAANRAGSTRPWSLLYRTFRNDRRESSTDRSTSSKA